MNEKIKRSVSYIFLLCFFSCSLFFNKLESYADVAHIITCTQTLGDTFIWREWGIPSTSSDRRLAFYLLSGQNRYVLCSNDDSSFTISTWIASTGQDAVSGSFNANFSTFNNAFGGGYDFYVLINEPSNFLFTTYNQAVYDLAGIPVFSDLAYVDSYLATGELPESAYNPEIELDSFKVTTWQIGNLQAIFQSQFTVVWSDSRISAVQVRVEGPAKTDTFESSSSAFKQKFRASQYVLKNGDVVHLVATPFTSSGSYGTSLYYSFVYNDKIPFSNVYRKFTNTPSNNNTLTIPYNDTSGNNISYDAPVEYVTTNNNYKVNYNPITNTYGDLNLYEVYYSPVIYYPTGTPDSEIDQTQDVVNNSYTTNNYYETTKNINIDFDVDFGDISGSDIQQGFDDFGNFSNGFGTFIGKLAGWVLALFPFLSPAVAATIVVVFGLVIAIAIIAIVLKIAGVIADLIPF